MRINPDNSIIFECTTEARVAAQLLADADQLEIVESIKPPVDYSRFDALEFQRALGWERRGQGDTQTYTCPPWARDAIMMTLGTEGETPPMGTLALTRRQYIGLKLAEMIQ